MAKKTFRGGAHPAEHKELTEHKQIVDLPAPQRATIPLTQHLGAAAKPIVEKDQQVLPRLGIGESGFHRTYAASVWREHGFHRDRERRGGQVDGRSRA